MLNTKTITQYPLKSDQYMQDTFTKTQIYLHHTEGSANPKNVIDGWNANSERIGTAIVIAGRAKPTDDFKSGEIFQCFSSSNWAYHLGLKQAMFDKMGVPYQSIDKISIGIELCSYGQLHKKSDGFYNDYGGKIPNDQVCTLDKPFKDNLYYHSYCPEQIASLKELLLFLGFKWNINLTYNDDIWDLTKRAFKGENGVFTHNSTRTDKSDVFPDPNLIAMLKSLKP